MFTVKYIMTDGCEIIDGPFKSVSFSVEDSSGNRSYPGHGFGVVRANRNDDSVGVTYGPVLARQSDDIEPVVYVMNASGATVATYRL